MALNFVKALLERMDRLVETPRSRRMRRRKAFLEREVWPLVPPELRGKRISSEDEDVILGYGPDGV